MSEIDDGEIDIGDYDPLNPDFGHAQDTEVRRNFLNVIKNKVGKKVLFRVVLLVRFADEMPLSVQENFDAGFKALAPVADNFTGLLLTYPRHAIAVVESSYEGVHGLLHRLIVDETNQECFTHVKVLTITANIQRLYKVWSIKDLNLVAPRVEGDYSTSEPIENTISEVLAQLATIGHYCSKLSQLQLPRGLESLQERVPEAIVSQDVIGYLLFSDLVPSPQSLVNRFSRPSPVKLDNEIMWPVAPNLTTLFGQ